MTISVENAAETYEDVAMDLNHSVQEVKNDSKKLLEDTYVEDGTSGSSIKEDDRMIGVKLPYRSISGTIPSMIKSWLKAQNQHCIALQGSRSLVKAV